MNRRQFFHNLLGLSALPFLWRCEDNMEMSVYQNLLSEDRRNTNFKQLDKILPLNKQGSSIKVAVVADTHTYYDEFNQAVDVINKMDDIDFLIHAGDITQRGYEREFILSQDIMNRLNIPYVAVIGNHECFSQNGEAIYQTMFGLKNFSFIYRSKKFVFFDSNREDTYFDLDWFRAQIDDLEGADSLYVVTHCPTVSYTFARVDDIREEFEEALAHPNITLTIFGHEHYHLYDADKKWLFVDYLKMKNFVTIEILPNGVYNYERIYY